MPSLLFGALCFHPLDPQRLTFFLQHARNYFELASCELKKRLNGVAAEIETADARVTSAQHEPRDLRLLHRPETHGTRFERRVKRSAREIECPQEAAGDT